MSNVAWAAPASDSPFPRITRLIGKSVPPGVLTFQTRIEDDSPILVATLYWRAVGSSFFASLPLQAAGAGALYSARLDVRGDFEFYVEAFDEAGRPPAGDGRAEEPILVTVDKLARASPPRPTTPPPPRIVAPPAEPKPAEVAPKPAEVAPKPAEPAPEPAPRSPEPVASPARSSLDLDLDLDVDLPAKPAPPEPSAPSDAREVVRKPAPVVAPPPVVQPAPPPEAQEPPPAEPPVPPMPRARVGRVGTANALVAGRGEVAFEAGLRSGTDFLLPEGKLLGGGGILRASYALHRRVELGLSVAGESSRLRASGLSYTGSSIGDLGLYARGVSPELGPARVALEVGVEIPSPVDGDHLAASPWISLASTLTTGVLRWHASAGYRWDNSERLHAGRWSAFTAYSLGLSRFDALSLGTALELVLGRFVPYFDYALEVPIERRHFAACEGAPDTCAAAPALVPVTAAYFPQRLGAGLRLEVATRVAVQLGAAISLTPAGRGFSDPEARSRPLPDGLLVPAPLTVLLSVAWQMGAPVPVSDPVVPSPTRPAATTAPDPTSPPRVPAPAENSP